VNTGGFLIDRLLSALQQSLSDQPYVEIGEREILDTLRTLSSDIDPAEYWETLSGEFRRRVVRRNRVFAWNLFRRVLCISLLPSREELERVQEIYEDATPRDAASLMRSLTGRQFELFLGELLPRVENFRNVVITKASSDGGIDFRAAYQTPANKQPLVIVGQAKQVAAAVGTREAREFVGALHLAREKAPVGLFISTSGFTKPASEVFDGCGFNVWKWGMDELLKHVFKAEVGVSEASITVKMIDATFWDELTRDSAI
jgi:Restriction endonuclease